MFSYVMLQRPCLGSTVNQLPQVKMMEVENRIESFGNQVEELPDELRDRKDRRTSGGSENNGVILEESEEDSRDGLEQGDGLEKSNGVPATAVGGRIIKKVRFFKLIHRKQS